MGKRPLRYHSFILTMWQEAGLTPKASLVWRIRLEDPYTTERHGFTNLTALVHYLNQWTENPPPEFIENV
jgi:hypothetical protein